MHYGEINGKHDILSKIMWIIIYIYNNLINTIFNLVTGKQVVNDHLGAMSEISRENILIVKSDHILQNSKFKTLSSQAISHIINNLSFVPIQKFLAYDCYIICEHFHQTHMRGRDICQLISYTFALS